MCHGVFSLAIDETRVWDSVVRERGSRVANMDTQCVCTRAQCGKKRRCLLGFDSEFGRSAKERICWRGIVGAKIAWEEGVSRDSTFNPATTTLAIFCVAVYLFLRNLSLRRTNRIFQVPKKYVIQSQKFLSAFIFLKKASKYKKKLILSIKFKFKHDFCVSIYLFLTNLSLRRTNRIFRVPKKYVIQSLKFLSVFIFFKKASKYKKKLILSIKFKFKHDFCASIYLFLTNLFLRRTNRIFQVPKKCNIKSKVSFRLYFL